MRLSLFALVLATPLAAQETILVSPCQDEGSTVTAEEMGRYLEGNWQMSAPGTGFTAGTNLMTVTLRYDDSAGALMMEGQGITVPLNPVGLARDLDAPAPPEADFDISVEALNPTGMSAAEIDLLFGGGCPRPMRYWWTFANGQSWGGLMFVDNRIGSGFMANSAGGTRNVMLSR